MSEKRRETLKPRALIALFIITFLVTTALFSAIINPMIGLEGSIKNLLIAVEFFITGFILYIPISKSKLNQ